MKDDFVSDEVNSDDNKACFEFEVSDDVLEDVEADENCSVDDFTEDCKNFEDDFRSGFNSDDFDNVCIEVEASDDTSDADDDFTEKDKNSDDKPNDIFFSDVFDDVFASNDSFFDDITDSLDNKNSAEEPLDISSSEAFDDECRNFEAEVNSDDNRACFDFEAFDDVLVDLEDDENGSVDDITEDCKKFEDDFRSCFISDGFDDVFVDLDASDDTSDVDGKSREDFKEDKLKYFFAEDDFKAGFDSDVFEELFVDKEAGDDSSAEEMKFVDSEAGCVPDFFKDDDCDLLESFEQSDLGYLISDDDFGDVFINVDARDDSTLDKLTDSDKNSDENSKVDIDSNALDDNKDGRWLDDHSKKYDENSDDDFKDSEISYDVSVDDKGRSIDEYEVFRDGMDFEGSDGVCSDLKATNDWDSEVLDSVKDDDITLLIEDF